MSDLRVREYREICRECAVLRAEVARYKAVLTAFLHEAAGSLSVEEEALIDQFIRNREVPDAT